MFESEYGKFPLSDIEFRCKCTSQLSETPQELKIHPLVLIICKESDPESNILKKIGLKSGQHEEKW